ncbi:MAG TPA: hypothetical protein VNZ52_09275 [Candidatus Thermoplasmatota archaeon]|nr:hypothetical protein [Candidatus Thermoplasmatota archaeon]
MVSRLLVVLLLLAVPLTGCLNDEAPAEDAAPAAQDGANETAVDTGSPLDAVGSGGADDPGSRAHKHDYWGGETQITIVDGDYDPGAEQPSVFCGWYELEKPNKFHNGCVFVQMGNGTIVYQGTSRMTVTATWSDPKTTGVALQYQDAQAFHAEGIPLANGVAHEIPVTLETADMAHARESKWMFVFVGSDASGGSGILAAPIHVTITIHRGLDLPVDPPHPDFWGDKRVLDLGNTTGTLPAETADFLVFSTGFESLTLPEGTVVPPGTAKLDVHFYWKVKDPAPGVAYHILPFWKSAQGPFWEAMRQNRSHGNPDSGEGYFEIEVTPQMTDSPYATLSQWRFAFPQTQHEPTTRIELPVSYFGTSPLNREIEVTLHVIAHRSAEGHDMDAMEAA